MTSPLYLSAAVIKVHPLEETLAALHLYAAHNLDFSNLFLAEIARTSGTGVAAFDRDYARLGVGWVNPVRQV